jgi:glycerophosphoryl diester phosphodiesterase
LAPRIPRALLFESAQKWRLRSDLAALVFGAGALHPEHVLASPDRVRLWRRRGYAIGCWTVDDPDTAARLVESGVTAIITNRPDVMRARWAQ